MPRTAFFQPVSAGVLTALVGFASSFAVVLAGLRGAGASETEAASGLFALCVAMGLAGVILSLATRMPISCAWSTPGGALLAATGAPKGGFSAAVGAFLIVGLAVVAAGLVRPLGRAVAAIPGSIANAMLAGVLFGLCLAPVKALGLEPLSAAIVLAVWILVGRWKRLFATPAAAIAAAVVIGLKAPTGGLGDGHVMPDLVFVTPQFSLDAAIGIALPLFLVTMASQNLPGLAVLATFGFKPKPGPLVAATGLFALAAAPFGGHAVNLSAITAALCASPDAAPDPSKRWIAAATAGIVYIALGLVAGIATRLVAASPVLIEAVAGLALLGAFGGALKTALADEEEREAAIVAFLFAASGQNFLHVGGAFWGLVAGGAMYALKRLTVAKGR